jgi:HPt (histidine-containing phosphotransfer) domain-containing protein
MVKYYQSSRALRGVGYEPEARAGQTPITGIGHSAPGIQEPESSIQDPASSNQQPASSIQYPVSSIQHPVPIIAMTGNAVEGGFNQSQYPGMNDCIGKPLQRDRLLEMVLKWTRPADDETAVDRPVADSLPVSKKSGKGRPPVDFNRAVQEFMGQKKLLFSVLKGFIENAGIRLDVIQRAVKSHDYHLIALEAHAIKGGAANLTVDVLAATAADLERAAVTQRTELTRQLAAELELDLYDLQTFIHENVVGTD